MRRTYLETIIRQLQDKQWIDREPWDKQLEFLAHRRRETSTNTVPKPTLLGKWLALSLFGVPLGSPFIAEAVREGLTLTPTGHVSGNFLIGLLLSFAPLLVLVFNCVRIKCWGKQRTERDGSGWALLVGHAITETKTETVESPNPTSIEFEEVFALMMQAALRDHSSRKILLVLDNLDRVDASTALQIWSTLQTFLQDRQLRRESWFKRLWILVPFDPRGLRKLWDKVPDTSTSSDDGNDSRDTQRAASESFLDKSFQVRFAVPPNVMSDWKGFLDQLIEKALPDHSETDRHLLCRVFDRFRPYSDDPPTPRELKVFVNQLGAIHRQWQHEFPIDHIAFFVLQGGDHRSLISRLRSDDFPPPSAVQMLADNLRENLTGLAFNVSADKGIELLLSGPIEKALSTGNEKALTALCEKHNQSFWTVLELLIDDGFGATDCLTLSKSAIALHKSRLLENFSSRFEVATIHSKIRGAISHMEWTPFDKQRADGISSLLALERSSEVTKTVLENLASSLLNNAKQQQDSQPDSSKLVEALFIVIASVEAIGHTDQIPDDFTIPCNSAGWKPACQEMIRHDPNGRFWSRIVPACDFKEVSTALRTRIAAGQVDQQDVRMIEVTCSAREKKPWTEVVQALRQRLDASTNLNCKECRLALAALCTLRTKHDRDASIKIKELVDAGHIMHNFERAARENDLETQAVCMYVYLKEKPNAIGNVQTGYQRFYPLLEKGNPAVASRLADLLNEFDDSDLLFKVADARGKYDRLIAECVRELAVDAGQLKLFTAETLQKRWRELRNTLGQGADETAFVKLVGRVAENTNLCVSLQKADSGFKSEDSGLYLAIIESTEKDLRDFSKWCVDGLSGMSQEAWLGDLSDEFAACRLAIKLAKSGNRAALSTPFEDALTDHAASLVNGKLAPPSDLRKDWATLLDCVADRDIRKVLRDRLVAALEKGGGSVDAAFFEIYGDELSDGDVLLGSETIVSHAFSPLVKSRNVSGLRWVRDRIAANPKFLKDVKQQRGVSEFENRLRECLKQPNDDEAQPLIGEIAKILKIKVAKK